MDTPLPLVTAFVAGYLSCIAYRIYLAHKTRRALARLFAEMEKVPPCGTAFDTPLGPMPCCLPKGHGDPHRSSMVYLTETGFRMAGCAENGAD